MKRTADLLLGLGVFVLAALACSGGTPASANNVVTKADYGDEKWPFIVDKVELRCEPTVDPRRQYVTLRANGKEYWLNGTAKGTGQYANLEEIWRTNPDPVMASAGARIALPSDLIQRGLRLCER